MNMGTRPLIGDDSTSGKSNNLFSDLLDFCIGSVATCSSLDADKLCVPVGLCALSALLLLLSYLVLVPQRRKFQVENPGETLLFFYCFVGNLCSTTGAILSRQLRIQILMGAFAAGLDAVGCMTCCFPVFLYWNSQTERRLRMMRKRRRQHFLAVCVLMAFAGGFAKLGVNHRSADEPHIRRRLLHVILQDNTEVLGYILGLISFVIACTSRFPALCRAYKGQMLSWASMLSGLLCSLAGVLYAAALLVCDTQFQFLLEVMPWLLSAISGAALNLLILAIHWCKRGTRQHPVWFSPDRESLLGSSGITTEEGAVIKKDRKQQLLSSAQAKMKNVQNNAEMDCYMDVSVHPARKICLKEVMSSREEVVDRLPHCTVRVIRVDRFCSSDTSCDSSSVSSDLEWDFEEANAQWREPTAQQQEGDKFPLQEWPENPKLFNFCVTSGLSQKTLSVTGEGQSVFALSCEK
ncbi:transmembrane protein 44 [Mastacembelus armatus]|uniref:transmembrane protein 44 n=1 Tax=Mastacembelus armatus TaxID=205130 RepID=UPI000E45B265|nr:transmembrane protein 44 [Mastacembelus armatus]